MKIAVITGGSSGIGLNIAIKLIRLGYKVINISRNKAVIPVEHNIVPDIFNIKLDLSKNNIDFEKMIEKQIINKFGTIDVLINCAGIMPFSTFTETTKKEYDEVMNVNLKSVFFLCQAVIPHMEHRGKIINISSIAGIRNSDPHIIHYSVSKAGVISLTKNLAKMYPNLNINCISPGLISGTNLVPGSTDCPESLIKLIPVGYTGIPKDVSDLVEFLISDKADFIHGANLVIDGGEIV